MHFPIVPSSLHPLLWPYISLSPSSVPYSSALYVLPFDNYSIWMDRFIVWVLLHVSLLLPLVWFLLSWSRKKMLEHLLLMGLFFLIPDLHRTFWHLKMLLPSLLIGCTTLLSCHLLVLLPLWYHTQVSGVGQPWTVQLMHSRWIWLVVPTTWIGRCSPLPVSILF